MLNGVLWSISYTKRIHLLCEIPTRDLCEPRKTSKRKLSYRFWKESWCIYFSILKQSPSVFFQQYSPFLLQGNWQGWLTGWERRGQEPGLRGDGHTQGHCKMGFRVFFFACAQMHLSEGDEKSGLFQFSRTSWGALGWNTARQGPEHVQDMSPWAAACLWRRVGEEELSCEKAKHPVLLYTHLLSLAKQGLIIITRRKEKEKQLGYNDVLCWGRLLYRSVILNTKLLVIYDLKVNQCPSEMCRDWSRSFCQFLSRLLPSLFK